MLIVLLLGSLIDGIRVSMEVPADYILESQSNIVLFKPDKKYCNKFVDKASNHMVYDRTYAMCSKLYDINIIYYSTNVNTSLFLNCLRKNR
jgi:hypothetical protein